jgi:hypothetical protein
MIFREDLSCFYMLHIATFPRRSRKNQNVMATINNLRLYFSLAFFLSVSYFLSLFLSFLPYCTLLLLSLFPSYFLSLFFSFTVTFLFLFFFFFLFLSFTLFLFLFLYSFLFCIFLSLYLSICLSIHMGLSIYLSIWLKSLIFSTHVISFMVQSKSFKPFSPLIIIDGSTPPSSFFFAT